MLYFIIQLITVKLMLVKSGVVELLIGRVFNGFSVSSVGDI